MLRHGRALRVLCQVVQEQHTDLVLDRAPYARQRRDAHVRVRTIGSTGIVMARTHKQGTSDFLDGTMRGEHRLKLRAQRPKEVAENLSVTLQRGDLRIRRRARIRQATQRKGTVRPSLIEHAVRRVRSKQDRLKTHTRRRVLRSISRLDLVNRRVDQLVQFSRQHLRDRIESIAHFAQLRQRLEKHFQVQKAVLFRGTRSHSMGGRRVVFRYARVQGIEKLRERRPRPCVGAVCAEDHIRQRILPRHVGLPAHIAPVALQVQVALHLVDEDVQERMLLGAQIGAQISCGTELSQVFALDETQRAHQQVRRFEEPLLGHERLEFVGHVA